jgi:archaellum component FlaC
MVYKELDKVFAKIEDCDFDGAVSEMYRLAQDFSENGKPEYSDFLATFASYSYQSNDLHQQTKPFSEISKKLESLDSKYDELIQQASSIVSGAFECFKEIESIATAECSSRLRFSGFNSTYKDNFQHIANFMSGDNTHINSDNVVEVFTNQLSFYMWLQVAGTYTLGNYNGRITNILPGKFWRFVELRKLAKSIKDSLDQIPEIRKELAELDKETNELRGHYWINDISSNGFKNDFLKSLEEFHDKISGNRLPALRKDTKW